MIFKKKTNASEPVPSEVIAPADQLENESSNTENTENVPVEKKRLPLFSKILLLIAAISAVFYIIFVNSPEVSDFFNKYISSIIRAILSYATTWIPFSLAEMMVILIPMIIVIVVLMPLLKILRLVPCQWIERIILIRGNKPRSLRCHAKLRRDWATRKLIHRLV